MRIQEPTCPDQFNPSQTTLTIGKKKIQTMSIKMNGRKKRLKSSCGDNDHGKDGEKKISKNGDDFKFFFVLRNRISAQTGV